MEKVEEIDRLERQLGRINQQLEESKEVIAQLQRQVELEQLRPVTDASSFSSTESQYQADMEGGGQSTM